MFAYVAGNLRRASYLFAGNRYDSIPRLKSGGSSGRAGRDIVNHYGKSTVVGYEIQKTGSFTVLSVRSRLNVQRDALAVAIDNQRQGLIGRQQSVAVNGVPLGILGAVELDYPIARFQTGDFGRAARANKLTTGAGVAGTPYIKAPPTEC